jgi:regulator of protease activity HflC (stomatin/prohibitin superfamily)
MELDDAFASKNDIGMAVMTQLKEVMDDYGYEILQALVTDMVPDANKVKASTNVINASRHLKEAVCLSL